MKGTATVTATDYNGYELRKGDTVTTLSGDLTARIYDIRDELDTRFVRLRPVHQPYQPGVWHAADRLIRLKVGKR